MMSEMFSPVVGDVPGISEVALVGMTVFVLTFLFRGFFPFLEALSLEDEAL
jgi:hypothetical protein